jgi:hypothetical protein
VIDSKRAAVLTELLLDAISARRSSVVIIDVTSSPRRRLRGRSPSDAHRRGARLMGTTAILADLADAVETATADPVDFAG